MAAIVAKNQNVTGAGRAILHTADIAGGTLNIRVLNAGENPADISLYLTLTPAAPTPADLVDMAKLEAGQALLLTGEPVKTGESVVVVSSGVTPNLACRVSGFMEA